MAQGISDLGTGLGYVYVTSPDGVSILKNVENTSINVREILKLDAVKAANITSNRSAVGEISIDSIAGAGNITAVTINAINQIATAINVAGLSESEIADAIALSVNSFTTAGTQYRAMTKDNVVVMIADEEVGSDVNGSTITVSNDDPVNMVIATEPLTGGANSDSAFDENAGYRFFLNADYSNAPGSCAGDGEAVAGDLTNAIEITEDIIPQSTPVTKVVILLNGLAETTRARDIAFLELDTEGAIAADDCEDLCPTGYSNGDRLLLYAKDNGRTINVKHGVGNIILESGLDYAISSEETVLELHHRDGQWYEISRTSNATEVLDGSITAIKLATDSVITEKILDENVTTQKLADASITTEKLAGGSVTADKIAAGAITVSKLDNQTNTALIVVSGSFETGEQGDYKIKFPFDCEVQEISAAVTKLIEATEDATIIAKNHAGDVMGGGVVNLPAGLAIGSAVDVLPISNNTFLAGESMKLTHGKTTPGGKVAISIKLLKSGSGTGGTITYQAPNFTAFVLVGFDTLEVGDNIPAGAQTFTWSTSNSGNVQPNSIDLIDVTGGSTILGSGLANDGTESVSLAGAITKTAIATHQFKVTAQNTQGGNLERTHNVAWQFRKFFGNDSNAGPLVEAQVEALANNPLDSGFAGTYFFPGGDYKYFAFPISWGTPSSFTDQGTMLAVPMEASYVVNLTNVHGVAENYNVFRTTNILGGDITIIVA